MNGINETQVTKDFNNKSILVAREFNAPLKDVWQAFTDSKILNQWWAPAPWHAETKYMDFSVGGYWLYAMVGPENEKHWGRMNYEDIDYLKKYAFEDVFSDEKGNVLSDLPASKGTAEFSEISAGTKVEFKTFYESEEDLKKMVEMGFEQGIKICFDQLQSLFKKQAI
ncbi:MAG: SRPBCC domain-containing protein [Bacteroidetes bacterium]|nr:SRPBCC domain-containing protein [Bacteroidota bacterium]HET6246043.1 SRPBCC domain-containing protein [Bacteroidia bacterium]